MQHICQVSMLIGAILVALGIYGNYYFGKEARNKQLPKDNKGVVMTTGDPKNQMNIGNIERIDGDIVQGDKIAINVDQRTSASYVPPDTSLRNMVLKNLHNLSSRHDTSNLQVIIEVEAGNSLRDKVANDLGEILSECNLGHYPKGNTYMGRFPDYPITVLCSTLNAPFAKELITSIEPLMTGKVGFLTDLQSDKIIKMYIYGTPTFSAKGEVRIE